MVIDPSGQPAKGKWVIMLGAVECSFKREILPYEAYEMWSRVLAWDRKWLYVVTHFVKKGAVRPDGYTLDDGSVGAWLGLQSKKMASAEKATGKSNGLVAEATKRGVDGIMGPAVPHKAVFASAISKYVIKLGRLTVHPEVMIEASGLLPPKPGGWNLMNGTATPANGTAAEAQPSEASSGDNWDWQRIEQEKTKGLKYAEHFAALDGLHEAFTGEDRPALGKYRDFIW